MDDDGDDGGDDDDDGGLDGGGHDGRDNVRTVPTKTKPTGAKGAAVAARSRKSFKTENVKTEKVKTNPVPGSRARSDLLPAQPAAEYKPGIVAPSVDSTVASGVVAFAVVASVAVIALLCRLCVCSSRTLLGGRLALRPSKKRCLRRRSPLERALASALNVTKLPGVSRVRITPGEQTAPPPLQVLPVLPEQLRAAGMLVPRANIVRRGANFVRRADADVFLPGSFVSPSTTKLPRRKAPSQLPISSAMDLRRMRNKLSSRTSRIKVAPVAGVTVLDEDRLVRIRGKRLSRQDKSSSPEGLRCLYSEMPV